MGFATGALPLLFLAASIAPALGQPQTCGPLKQIASLPIEYINNGTHALVPVTINNTPARMLFDTGGNVTAIAPATAQLLGLRPVKSKVSLQFVTGGASGAAVKLDSFGIGPLHGEGQYFQVAPGPIGEDSERIDGVLANDILQNYDIDLDFDANTLSLFSPNHCPGNVVYWGASVVAAVPFEKYGRSSIGFYVALDGKRLWAILDTGAFNTALDSSDAESFPADHAFKELSLGGLTVKNPKIFVARFSKALVRTPDLLLGMNVLRSLHIYISMKESKVYVSPRATPLPQDIPAPPPGNWQAAIGSGCKLFTAAPGITDRVEWSGGCENGLASGEGVKTVRGYGDRLERVISGTYRAGRLEGPGSVRLPDGRVFKLNYRNGVPVADGKSAGASAR